jgi:hypothetical protein
MRFDSALFGEGRSIAVQIYQPWVTCLGSPAPMPLGGVPRESRFDFRLGIVLHLVVDGEDRVPVPLNAYENRIEARFGRY